MATGAPQHSSIISPSGYLRLEGEGSLGPWIQSNYDSLMSVQILELEDLYKISDYSIRNMTQLNQLTHLYISGYECLPDSYFATNTRLRHLSFENGDKIISNDSLSKLSNLESLHIDLNGPKLPANINFPASIKCLSLRGGNMKTLHDSLAKLPNLKTIDLYEFRNLNLFPTNLYLAKVRLIDCSIASLPTCLLHLEILCNNPFTCEVGQPECINKLVNLKTLSISCHEMEFVPSMETLYNLETLQFKDCSSLKELPSYLGELVSLRNLDISGTRIKSLPGSIMKLCNLQHLILPGCFSLETLPRNLTQVFTIDNTLETYYKGMGYFFSGFQTSTEISDSIVTARGCTQTQGRESCNEIVPVAGVDKTVSSEQGSKTSHVVSYYFNMKKYESATSSELRGSISQVHKDSQFSATKDLIYENSQYAACSSRNQFSSSRNDDLATFFKQPLATMTSENDLVTFFKQLVTMTSENERLPTKVNADKLLEDSQFNGKDLINEKSQYVTCSSQNQFSTSGNGDFVTIFDDDLNTELRLTTVTSENEQLPKKANADKILDDLCYNKGETSNPSGESSHAMQNTFTQEIKQGIAPTCDTKEIDCGEINHCALESEQNYIPQSNNVRVKMKRKDITLEMLQPFRSNRTKLVDAAKELGVGRSTLKRRIKKLGVEWREKETKQHLDAKKRKLNNKAPFGSDCSQQNLVNLGNSAADHAENVEEHIMGSDLHTLPNHISSNSNVVINLTPDATMETIRGNSMETIRGKLMEVIDSHQGAEVNLDGANEHTLSDTLPQNEKSSNFTVKATYKDDTIRFDFSLSKSIDQLKKEVGKRLDIEVSTFKLKYQDEEKEWILLTCISDLEHALNLLRSSNDTNVGSVVRLLVVLKA